MEVKLHFVIDTLSGETVTQDFGVPPDAIDGAINQIFAQYSQIGVLKKDGNKFILLPASQLKRVEVETPMITLATDNDVKPVANATSNIKKIIV